MCFLWVAPFSQKERDKRGSILSLFAVTHSRRSPSPPPCHREEVTGHVSDVLATALSLRIAWVASQVQSDADFRKPSVLASVDE